MKCIKCGCDNNRKFCWNCNLENSGSEFKCRNCGEKYLEHFCSTDDVSKCKWCSNEVEE